MTDDTPPTGTPEAPEQPKSPVEAARSEVIAALGKWEAAIRAETRKETQESFSTWLEGMVKKVTEEEAAKQAQRELGRLLSTVPMNDPAEKPPPANDRVLAAISRWEGKRGVELLELVNQSGPKMLERTFRTALYRLKLSYKIKVIDGRWYLHETEPAVEQPKLVE